MNLKEVKCECGKRLTSVDVDTKSNHKTSGHCTHCKKRYSITYGNGVFSVEFHEKKNDALSEADEILKMIEKNEIESKEYWDNFEKEIRPLEKELDKI